MSAAVVATRLGEVAWPYPRAAAGQTMRSHVGSSSSDASGPGAALASLAPAQCSGTDLDSGIDRGVDLFQSPLEEIRRVMVRVSDGQPCGSAPNEDLARGSGTPPRKKGVGITTFAKGVEA